MEDTTTSNKSPIQSINTSLESDESKVDDSLSNPLNEIDLSKLHSSTNIVCKSQNGSLKPLQLKFLKDIKRYDCDQPITPLSELAANLCEASLLGTPKSSRKNLFKNDSYESLGAKINQHSSINNKDDMNNICLTSSDINDDSSLISNNFSLDSAHRNNLARPRSSGRTTELYRSRFAQRLLDDILEGNNSGYDDSNLFDKNSDEMRTDEVSFYGCNSPRSRSPQPCPSSPIMDIAYLPPEGSPQRFTVVHDTVTIVDNDRLCNGNTSATIGKSIETNAFQKFHFTEPRLPKPSPQKLHQNEFRTRNSPKNSFRIFNSLSSTSTESMEDEYMELFDLEPLEDESNFPTDLNSLISGDIKNVKTTPELKRPVVRRCLSLTDSSEKFQARSLLFEPKTPEVLKPIAENSPRAALLTERCFKRPEPPSNNSPIQCKRYKLDIDEKENSILNSKQFIQEPARPILRKSISMNDAHIMTALARSSSEPDLIGDFSKPFCLPLMDGRHQDLKSISCETMAKLIRGEYNASVASFKIIDCRYPYEYDGGHICGAQNLYTHEQILEDLVNCKTEIPTVQADGPKRHILVFHCEFSSERGPKLSRFLRNNDRQRNTSTYPALHYPEIYLLHGGYKDFFEKYSDLCEPNAYRPMLHPSYADHYKQCRAKSKSWSGDTKASGSVNRLLKSRSRLVL